MQPQDPNHVLHRLIEFGGTPWMELNHTWNGINVLSVLECCLLAAVLLSVMALFARFIRKSKRLTALSLAGALSFATAAYAANTQLSLLSASGALAGANLIYVVQTAGSGGVKATMTQVATFINSLFSGDFTCASGGACTLKNTGPGATGPIGGATTVPIVTLDAQGRTTALTSTTITQPSAANPSATAGPAANNGVATTFMRSDGTPAVQKGSNAQFGIVEGDGTTITCVLGVCSQVAATPSAANPSATAGPTANNGSASTFMRSDASPAVQKATNAQFGLMEGDGTTISCVAGVCTATTGGTGTVTSVSAGCGTSTGGSAITTTGTVTAALTARTNTATSGVGADFVSSDCGGIVYDNSASSIAVSLPVATTSGFGANTFFARCNINAGVSTITPVTSTIGGAATLVVGAGTLAKPTCVYFRSDGANYFLTETPFGTAATQNTGTSGGTLPFLNGTNTWSGTQTFGSVFGTVTTQSGTTYTLASTDCGTEIAFTNAAAITVTIPAALTTGCNIAILQTTSAGQVTVTGTAVSAATLHSAHSYTKTFGQWAIIGINIETTGVAILTGDGA